MQSSSNNNFFNGLRRDLDFPSEDVKNLKEKIKKTKLPAIKFRDQIKIMYENTFQSFSKSTDITTLKAIKSKNALESVLNQKIIELKQSLVNFHELDIYLKGEVIKQSYEAETNYSTIMKNIETDIQEKQIIIVKANEQKVGFEKKLKELENEAAEVRKQEARAHQSVGRGGHFQHGHIHNAFEPEITQKQGEIKKVHKDIEGTEKQMRFMTSTKKDCEKVSTMGKMLLNDLASLSNEVSASTVGIDHLITDISSSQINLNLKLTELSIEDKLEHDLEDPQSLRDETLNLTELQQRLNILDKSNNRSPKSQTEFKCLTDLFNDYKKGGLEGQIREVGRIKSNVAYYYVRFPEFNAEEILAGVISKLSNLEKFLNSFKTQSDTCYTCLTIYSEAFDNQIKNLETEIQIREQKNKYLNDIQNKSGCGEKITDAIYYLAKDFMNMEKLKGVLMVVHKDRHYADVNSDCPIIETDTYTIYLGIQKGWIKMKSYQGGFLGMVTYYHRGYENWCFGGVGGYSLPPIEDNGIKINL